MNYNIRNSLNIYWTGGGAVVEGRALLLRVVSSFPGGRARWPGQAVCGPVWRGGSREVAGPGRSSSSNRSASSAGEDAGAAAAIWARSGMASTEAGGAAADATCGEARWLATWYGYLLAAPRASRSG
jgi:hypothetical protein